MIERETLARAPARVHASALVLTVAIAAAVGVAFADSSIVVLALPELYLELDTSIFGVSWVITAYNLVVAVGAFALLPLTRRVRASLILSVGLAVFLGASIGCGVSGSLAALVACRAVQGLGAALVMAAALPVLVGLTGSARAGLVAWTTAGTVGVAVGPALGGLLTELFDWQAIFIAQAPIAGAALLATLDPRVRAVVLERARASQRGTLASNLGLLFVFGALVGALFLAVVLIVTVWDFGPLAGAGIVSALPAAAVAVRPLSARLPGALDVFAGAILLAIGLLALALLPASSAVYAVLALALCGAGFGLAVPPLTRGSVSTGAGLAWSGTTSVGVRHVGLVLALLAVAPLLGHELAESEDQAALDAAAVILDAPLTLQQKIPIALDLSAAFERTPEGEVPDLARPFEENGAANDPEVRETRDSLLGAIEAVLTRGFRNSFALAAGFAILAILPILLLRRRVAD